MKLGGNIANADGYGWSSVRPDEYSAMFIEYSQASAFRVLDVGAGLGSATLGALAAGATVIANDTSEKNLRHIEDVAPLEAKSRLQLLSGRFPEIELEPASLGAVNLARVLHFLTGAEIERGIAKLHRWLVPGGKVFLLATTPWCGNAIEYLHLYEAKKGKEQWPGETYGIRSLVKHPTVKYLPDLVHSLDVRVLRRAFEAGGLPDRKAASLPPTRLSCRGPL